MKNLILRIHGMNVSPKFNIPIKQRDDKALAERRQAEQMERGELIHQVAPCRTDVVAHEIASNAMFLCDIHVQMMGDKGTTPVLTLSYTDSGREPFRLTLTGTPDEIDRTLVKYRAWLAGIMTRSWESGQLYRNPNGLISVNVVGPLKLDGEQEAIFTSDLLEELEQQASA